MGFLSDTLGKVGGWITDATDAVSSVLNPVNNFLDGSGLGSLLDTANTAFSTYNNFNKSSMKDAMAFAQFKQNLQTQAWKEQYGQRHQLEVEDLRKAGLNPILSANSAGGVSASMASGGLLDSDSARSSAASQRQMVNQAAKQLESQISVNGSQIYRNNAEADAIQRQADYAGMRTLSEIKLQRALANWYNVQSTNANDPMIKYSSAMSTGGALLGGIMGSASRLAPSLMRKIPRGTKGLVDRDGSIRWLGD